MSSENRDSSADHLSPRLLRVIDGFRQLIRNETLHIWIARAFLSKKPVLAPMIVERGETLNDNLRRVFAALTAEEQAKFRAAISRAVDSDSPEKFWPAAAVSQARALRDVLRLARLSRHYGLLSWIGDELISIFGQPTVPSDLPVLGEIVAIIDGAQNWAPSTYEGGPDHRAILSKLSELFGKLGHRVSLSFFDAALLLPAVRYDADGWHLKVCAAIRRYDVGSKGIFPDDLPLYGTESSPEGRGVYDIRRCIVRLVREVLTVSQFQAGVRALVNDLIGEGTVDSPASEILVEILIQLGLLKDWYEYIPPAAEPDPARRSVMQLARLFFIGPEFIELIRQDLCRFINNENLNEWFEVYWALAVLPTNAFLGHFAHFHPIALLPGAVREKGETMSSHDAIMQAEARDPETRSFKKFRERRSASRQRAPEAVS